MLMTLSIILKNNVENNYFNKSIYFTYLEKVSQNYRMFF